ncbi:MAG: hypothetical protein VR70_16385, partial [Rhodospirillaceae bacterium BRH_c57]
MAIEIKVPALGESVSEGTVAKWFKKVGDTVAVDEPLLELETDKVTVEVPAPSAGTIQEIVAAEGAEVEVGAVLCVLAEGDDAPAAKPAAAKTTDTEKPAAAPAVNKPAAQPETPK